MGDSSPAPPHLQGPPRRQGGLDRFHLAPPHCATLGPALISAAFQDDHTVHSDCHGAIRTVSCMAGLLTHRSTMRGPSPNIIMTGSFPDRNMTAHTDVLIALLRARCDGGEHQRGWLHAANSTEYLLCSSLSPVQSGPVQCLWSRSSLSLTLRQYYDRKPPAPSMAAARTRPAAADARSSVLESPAGRRGMRGNTLVSPSTKQLADP